MSDKCVLINYEMYKVVSSIQYVLNKERSCKIVTITIAKFHIVDIISIDSSIICVHNQFQPIPKHAIKNNNIITKKRQGFMPPQCFDIANN